MSSPKGWGSTDKDADKRAQHATLEHTGEKQYGLTTSVRGQYKYSAGTDQTEANSTASQIVATAHTLRVGDVIRFTSATATAGLQDREAVVEKVIDANNFQLAEALPAVPALDDFEILRPRTPVINSDGTSSVTAGPLQFQEEIGAGTVTVNVFDDQVTPANSKPLPVKLTSTGGDITITADNIDVQLEHNGATPDSVQIGDGTELMSVTADNMAEVQAQGNVASDAADSGRPVKVGGVYVAAGITLDDGDRGDLQLDVNGRVLTSGTISSSVADNAPDTENPLKIGGRYNLAAPTYADGDKADLQMDVNGRVLVSGSFSSSVADNAPDTENPLKIGGRYNLAAPTYADGDKADLQMDVNGRVLVSGTFSSSVADNAPDTENPIKMGSRYNLAAQTYADGDKADLQSNVNGHVIVDPRQATHDNLNANANLQVGNADVANGNPVPVSDAGGSLTVDQATHDNLNANANLQVGDADVANGNPVPISDAGGSVTVDQATHDNLNANANLQVANADVANGNPVPISDAGGSVTVDQATHDNLNANANIQVGDADVAVGNPVPVAGTIADNAADSGNPVKAGTKYNAVAPTYGDGDRADLQGDVNGNLKVSIEVDNAGIGGGGGGGATVIPGPQARYMNQLKQACAAGTATATDFTWSGSIAGDQTYFYRDVTVTSSSATLSSGEVAIIFCRNFTVNGGVTMNMSLQRSNTTYTGRHYSYTAKQSYANSVLKESLTEAADEIVMWDVHKYLTDPYSVFRGQMDTTGIDTTDFDTFVPGSIAWDYEDRQLAFDDTAGDYYQRHVKTTSWPGAGSRNVANAVSGGVLIVFCENDFTNNGTIRAEATGAVSTGGGGSVCIVAFNDITEGTIQIGGQAGYFGYLCALYGNSLTTGTIGHSVNGGTGKLGNGKVTRQKFYESILNGL